MPEPQSKPEHVMCAYCHHEGPQDQFFKTQPMSLLMCNDFQACETRGYYRDREKGLPARQLVQVQEIRP